MPRDIATRSYEEYMEPLLELRNVGKTFASGEDNVVTVLQDISLSIESGEIAVLLGRSGCGKSTLLRIMSGLTPASSGEVRYRGRRVRNAQQGISMVFQSFALFPWLNVRQNVELGLEARGVARAQRERQALAAIDMIGLHGFETAYPKELSGGMRQRVGFARALVVDPDVLLMDEAFSALDVPTAETLRNDLLDLWLERQIPTRAIVMVSHSIEESLLLGDRVVILDNNPGRIKTEIRVGLRHPRDRDSHAFRRLTDQVYAAMTAAGAPGKRALGIGHRLPQATVGQMLGVLEVLNQSGRRGSLELSALDADMQMEAADLLAILESLELLEFARVSGQRAELTSHGRGFVEADIPRRKTIFGEHLVQRVPLAAHIVRVLDEREGSRAPRIRFLRELEDYLTEDEAERVLAVVTDWGRYAEIFAYEDAAAIYSSENRREDVSAEQIS